MHPKEISIQDFGYELPDDRIARHPLEKRDDSRLLIWDEGQISEDRYANIARHLPADSFLVFNNTRVVEARLLFEKPNGGRIEIFCLEPDETYADITTAMLQKGKVWWKCLVGGAKKWKEGKLQKTIATGNGDLILTAEKSSPSGDAYLVELSWNHPSLSFAEVLHLAGAIPLPPYLNRAPEQQDLERYQTVYAAHDGSVAAPTAGLHFTPALFSALAQKGIAHDFVTLHVGAGTFKPVKAATMESHEMHAEFIDVSVPFLERLMGFSSGPVIAVGTTSLRTLESLYWMGVKILTDPSCGIGALTLSQWEAYDLPGNYSLEDSIGALISWLRRNGAERLLSKTRIIIAPGYVFRVASALVTNFHQPQSTLLLLVSAITGSEWRKIYDYALEHGFRFLSYGDGSLLWMDKKIHSAYTS